MIANKIFFNKISILNFPLMLLFGIFGFKVYFLKSSFIFKSRKISNYLKYLNIIKIDFNNQNHSISQKFVQMKKRSYLISKNNADKIIKGIWSRELKNYFIEKTFLKIFLTNYLTNRVFDILLIYEFAFKMQNDKQKLFFWINKNSISKEASKSYINFIILKPQFLNFFSELVELFSLIVSKFKIKFNKSNHTKSQNKSKIINLKKYKTIFFVSGGIVSAKSNYLNLKNFFFSKKLSSPIHKNNIIICETLKSLHPASLIYFKKLKLEFFYWYKNSKRVMNVLSDSSFIFIKIIFRPILFSDPSTSLRICWAILEIKSNLRLLKNLPNLKNAIIDNEFQFSTTLAIALKHKKININCHAKRLIYPAQKHQFIVDNYFIFGKETLKDLNHQFYKKINPIIIGGQETISKRNTLKYLNKYKKSYKLICLVLDYHSDKNWYNSSISPLVNWSENLKFYKLILDVAQNFPEILFVLKGKNYNWTQITFFDDIHAKLKKQKNLILFSNKVKMTNYEMTQNADFSIARWTSLVDDFLMNNKPVIVYDKPPYITGLIKYPSNIMSYNLENLVKKIEKLQKNIKSYNYQLNSFRKSHYTIFDLKKYQKLLIKVLK